jgi:hypothetical protein
MQSAKKSTKVLSALAVAAAAAAAAQSAHGATLSLFYGADGSYANSNNGIFVGSGYDPTGSNANATGGAQFLTGAVTAITPVVGGPTTITVPVGSYLSIALDAVLTGNANAAAGTKQAGDAFTQPAFIGLSELGMIVQSTDLKGTLLTPYSTDTTVETTIGGLPTYNSTAVVNGAQGTNNGGGYNAVPTWLAIAGNPGGVQPNLPGYDTAPNSSGGVGLGANNSPNGGAFPVGGNTSTNARTSGSFSTATAQSVLGAFAAQSNTSSYANATDFLDSLSFKALAAGTVTLSPSAVPGASEYWKYNGNAVVSTKTTSTYAATNFGANDSIGTLPVLVINIGTGVTTGNPSHPIIFNSSGAGNSNYNPLLGTLTMTGSNGSYHVASMTVPSTTAIGTTEAHTFNPGTDQEVWAYDVLVNGTQANATQIATLVHDINLGGGGAPASAVTASATSPVPNPFSSFFDIFVDVAPGNADQFQGIDLTPGNDSNLAGYTISAVAVVPEPVTLGLLAVGGVGLMARRHRRKA